MTRHLGKFAKRLRHNQTDAEQLLWYHLRGKRLGGYKFRRQHRISGFIADFACPAEGLVVEVDGGHHLDTSCHDIKRTEAMRQCGYRVIRFWDNEVLMNTDTVLEEIFRVLESNPSP